jgi:hypothetical protein
MSVFPKISREMAASAFASTAVMSECSATFSGARLAISPQRPISRIRAIMA